jgi:hypothetical protein
MQRRLKHLWGAALGMGLLLLAACGAQSSPAVSTVQTAATQVAPTAAAVAPTAAAAATQVAPTAAAVATKAGPTVAAAATQIAPAATAVAGTAAPIAATAAASAPLRIVEVQANPTDPTVRVQNTSTSAIDLSGYAVRVGDARAELPASATVRPGETVTIHLGAGTSTATDIYLGQAAATLVTGFRSGAQVAIVDAQGQPVAQFTIP